jgi:hypothetical protein
MPLSKEETFYLEEYKSLRAEMTTKLKDRLEFNRWGLIGLAALYSYIFANPGNPILFGVPVALSLAMIPHLLEEHRIAGKAAKYIEDDIERWIAVGVTAPRGWETYLKIPTPRSSLWPPSRWLWPPSL